MLILGLQRGHDAGASIFVDGKLAVICEGERVLGVKHADGVGVAAAAAIAALKQINADPRDVDAIVIADSDRDNIETTWDTVHTHSAEGMLALGTVAHMTYIGGDIGVPGLKPTCPIYGVCHHLAHAMSAFFMSGFECAAALVVDGYGVCAGTAAYRLDGKHYQRYDGWNDRFLLGWRYQLFGEFAREIDKNTTLPYDMAGKVMGLQAYGTADNTDYFKRWFHGDFTDYKTCWQAANTHFFADLEAAGNFTRNSSHVKDPAYLNALASMQKAFSDTLCEAVEQLLAETKTSKIVLSGGCALNVVSNTEIARRIGVNRLFIPPNAGDTGLALGAAVVGSLRLDTYDPFVCTSYDVKRSPFNGLSLHHDKTWDDIKREYPVVDRSASAPVTVDEITSNLAEGNIIGFVHGRCETGPRALGHRSILANPIFPNIKDLINEKIKKREWWRPFAPVCRAKDAATYFEVIHPCPYMLYSAYVRQEWRERLPSITHIDGSARLQVIERRDDNPLLWDILTELESRTGCGVLLNTSFNLGGRPIVNTLSEIVEMMDTSRLDAVWVEDKVIYKKNNQYKLIPPQENFLDRLFRKKTGAPSSSVEKTMNNA